MNETSRFNEKWLLADYKLPEPDLTPQRRLAAGLARRREPESPFDIIGQYAAFIVVTYIDAADAQLCLPPGLELMPPPGVPGGKHIVMYSFGSHAHVHPRFFTLFEYDYAEALVGLPHIALRHGDGTTSGPFFHMTGVRLNNRFANDIGVALGFPKKLATFEITNTTYGFRMHPHDPMLMSGSFGPLGAVFDDQFPHFKAIAPFLQQPVISRSPIGAFLITPFFINTKTAWMQSMAATIDIADNSLPGLPRGSYHFDGIETTAIGGGYHSVHDWQMSPPAIIDR
jgi:hypothetical protein